VLVKRLHLLETIAARIGDANGSRVYLTPELDDLTVEPAEAAVRALESPMGHPPLSQAIVPGDRVAIAVGTDVPQSAEIVRGVVETFAKAGIGADSCSVVVANARLAEHLRSAIQRSQSGGGPIQVVLHDPDDERDLCFVGVNRKNQPLVVNRTIFDADMVLPIGRAQPYGGAYESLYPQFSNAAVIEEFRTPANRSTQTDRQARRRATISAGERIGAPLVMQVVPGAGATVSGVFAGEPRMVARSAAASYRAKWSQHAEQRASLIVATVTGGAESQTWNDVAQAIVAAARLVEDEGAIAICTNLDRPLGESMGRLVGQRSPSATARKVFRDHAEDSWAAWRIARAIARGPVYLMSQLEADAVEEMGMAPIENIDELVRLAGRRESTIVLEDAQYALATVGSDVD
jgi:nickel-dependent lactate racemase